MTDRRKEFTDLALSAVRREALKKIVFSRPVSGDVKKISGRLCAHRGRVVLALEYSLPGDTVSQKNISDKDVADTISDLIKKYNQVNLITALGDAEWKISSSGKEALLGADKLKRKLCGEAPAFESAIEALDKKKNYILRSDEEFLIRLGISDKNGRIHDKKQGKFRQINRFLEYVEGIYPKLPADGELLVYDLCCGKSYLSFAVYYYLTAVKKRTVKMLGIDLKRDVIEWCASLAKDLCFDGMRFVTDDVTNTPKGEIPDMVISLHACDIATDIVINTAARLGAGVILSTPCCHRYLNGKITARELSFVTENAHISNKLAEAITDSLRVLRLRSFGYTVDATELTDPDDTPKNTLIRAIRTELKDVEIEKRKNEYEAALKFVLGDKHTEYLKEI